MRIEIRVARRDDAESLAHAWRAFGRDYAQLDPQEFRVPELDGLASWFEARLDKELREDATWLVAEHDERVVGFVQAEIWRPSDDAGRQLLREITEPILKVVSLMVFEDARGAGVATTLMEAVERWGKEAGATRAVVVASLASAEAVGFYEERMRYERKTLGLSKRL